MKRKSKVHAPVEKQESKRRKSARLAKNLTKSDSDICVEHVERRADAPNTLCLTCDSIEEPCGAGDVDSNNLTTEDSTYTQHGHCQHDIFNLIKDEAVDSNLDNHTESKKPIYRALQSLPKLLTVQFDKATAHCGIYAKSCLPDSTTFGPYQGTICDISKFTVGDKYCWCLYDHRTMKYTFITGQDRATANWMRHVRFTPQVKEQNLEAIQHHGELYYRTIHDIGVGEEICLPDPCLILDECCSSTSNPHRIMYHSNIPVPHRSPVSMKTGKTTNTEATADPRVKYKYKIQIKSGKNPLNQQNLMLYGCKPQIPDTAIFENDSAMRSRNTSIKLNLNTMDLTISPPSDDCVSPTSHHLSSKHGKTDAQITTLKSKIDVASHDAKLSRVQNSHTESDEGAKADHLKALGLTSNSTKDRVSSTVTRGDKSVIICCFCNKALSSRSALFAHMNDVHDPVSYKAFRHPLPQSRHEVNSSNKGGENVHLSESNKAEQVDPSFLECIAQEVTKSVLNHNGTSSCSAVVSPNNPHQKSHSGQAMVPSEISHQSSSHAVVSSDKTCQSSSHAVVSSDIQSDLQQSINMPLSEDEESDYSTDIDSVENSSDLMDQLPENNSPDSMNDTSRSEKNVEYIVEASDEASPTSTEQSESRHDAGDCESKDTNLRHEDHHYARETKEITLFRCGLCSKTWQKCCHVLMHINRKHTNSSASIPVLCACKRCNPELEGILAYNQDAFCRHAERFFQCAFCEIHMDKFTAMVSHSMKRHSSWSQYQQPRTEQCRLCRVRLIDKAALVEHLNGHFNDLNIYCDVCRQPFPTYARYIVHRDSHPGKIFNYECHKCRERFRDRFEVYRHMGKAHDLYYA